MLPFQPTSSPIAPIKNTKKKMTTDRKGIGGSGSIPPVIGSPVVKVIN